MFNRVRDSLVYPKEILKYRKDRVLFVLFYIFFFGVLLSSRTIIDVAKYDGLSNAYKAYVEENLTIIDDDCQIDNALLVCDSEDTIMVYEEIVFAVYLDSHNTLDYNQVNYGDKYTVVLHDDSAYFYMFGMNTMILPLTDLPNELQNIDFTQQVTDSNAFYNNLFTGLDKLILGYKNIWGPMMIGIEILISIAFYLFFISISAWFLKMRYKIIPFKETFAMTTYSSTSLFIILTFYTMLDLNIFIVIILLVVSFRQSGIMNKEIDRRLKKNS